ncbi:MAG: hypothetical protein MOGMAGMI_02036 [Candidatus Omnitrophica bacterium]|jgi:hypothetical protein|nr:hypothetical protein [Candidatus Omnitrophota bacterium]
MNNNDLVSAAISVSIEVNAGKIYLPDVLDLKGKIIKAIDWVSECASDWDGNACDSSGAGLYLNLMKNETQQLFIKGAPLSLFDFAKTQGDRIRINEVVDLPNSFFECSNITGKRIILVFWYVDAKTANIYTESDDYNFESFDVVVRGNEVNTIPFGENRSLYNKYFKNLIVQDVVTTANARTSVPAVAYRNTYMTLQKDNYKFVRNLPLCMLNSVTSSGQNVASPIRLQNIQFEFNNSYLTVSPSYLSSLTAATAFQFTAQFKR